MRACGVHSDPFVKILKPRAESTLHVPVHQTEVVKKNLNPVWVPLSLPLSVLGGAMDVPLVWEVWDYDNDGSHDYIGAVTLSVAQISAAPVKEWQVMNAKKKKKGGVAGTLCFDDWQGESGTR